MHGPLPLVGATIVLATALQAWAASPGTSARVEYTADVRPILSENCFYCHGQDANKRMAHMQLNTHEGQQSSGVIVPGEPDKSELVRRIFAEDPSDRMPPADSNRQLTEEQKQVLRRWIEQGAPFEEHWAFQPIKRPAVPKVDDDEIQNPIDAFVRAKLREEGLSPSAPAAKEILIRRVYLDLTGLPPTPREVEAFVSDSSPRAYAELVDRLLTSPHYGERMALPWLDAARYADSNGFQQDGDTFQWYWRDWVVRALNENMPFDQFTIEQLAGDLLPNATQDQKVATAFLRNHMLNGEGGAIPEEQRYVILVDRVNTVATNWLGLTMACAQCHDHKYDTITMHDYYGLMDALDNIPENGVVPIVPHRIRVAEPLLDVATPEQKQKLAAMQARLAELKEQQRAAESDADTVVQEWIASVAADESYPNREIRELALQDKGEKTGDRNARLRRYYAEHVAPQQKESIAAQIIALEREIEVYRNDHYPRVMVMEESAPRNTYIYDRGSYDAPLEKIEFDTPAFLPDLPEDAPRNRLGLARWLVSDENPLTARVIVNRQWQLFFGAGLVKTSEDFGVQGDLPVHRELLDWLASEFRESGWDLKALHRLIVTSATYRQSSRITPELLTADPENRLYARASRFRLPAMLIRDQALAVGGLLNPKIGGQPVYPYQQPGVWDSLNITKERSFEYPRSTGDDLYRRSLYTFWRRTVAPDNLFDVARRNECQVRVTMTNTPLHALVTLNDPTYVEAARVLAARAIESCCQDTQQQLNWAFAALVCRQPTPQETNLMTQAFRSHLEAYRQRPTDADALLSVGDSPNDPALDRGEHAAMTAVCLTLMNMDETLTRE